MLTSKDSKRVADALIDKINSTYIESEVRTMLKELLMPPEWHKDWFPATVRRAIQDMKVETEKTLRGSLDDLINQRNGQKEEDT